MRYARVDDDGSALSHKREGMVDRVRMAIEDEG